MTAERRVILEARVATTNLERGKYRIMRAGVAVALSVAALPALGAAVAFWHPAARTGLGHALGKAEHAADLVALGHSAPVALEHRLEDAAIDARRGGGVRGGAISPLSSSR